MITTQLSSHCGDSVELLIIVGLHHLSCAIKVLFNLIKISMWTQGIRLLLRACKTSYTQIYFSKCEATAGVWEGLLKPSHQFEWQTQSPGPDKAAQWPWEVNDCTEISPTLMFNLYDFPGYEILLISSSKLSVWKEGHKQLGIWDRVFEWEHLRNQLPDKK